MRRPSPVISFPTHHCHHSNTKANIFNIEASNSHLHRSLSIRMRNCIRIAEVDWRLSGECTSKWSKTCRKIVCITYWCGAFRLWRHHTWNNVFNCMPLFLAENMKAFPILQRLRIIGVRLTKIDETLSVGKFFMLERLYGCTKIREPWAVY